MSKYMIPKSKDGKDSIGFLTDKMAAEMDKRFVLHSKGKKMVGIGRDNMLYALVYYHKCGRYVAYTLRPLTYPALEHVARVMARAKETFDFLKKQKGTE